MQEKSTRISGPAPSGGNPVKPFPGTGSVHAARVAYGAAGVKVFSIVADKKTALIASLYVRLSTRENRMTVVPIWDESFSVHVKRCDEDHKKLLAIIQRLHESVVNNQGPVDTQGILAELLDYTETHFATEEGMLEQTKFPGLEMHCHQHQTFKDKLEELKKSFEYAPNDTALAVMEYLKNWLVRHIKMVDCQYSKHLNANGIQ